MRFVACARHTSTCICFFTVKLYLIFIYDIQQSHNHIFFLDKKGSPFLKATVQSITVNCSPAGTGPSPVALSHKVRRAVVKPSCSPTASKRAKHSTNKIFLPVDLAWIHSSPLYGSPLWDPLQGSSEQAESAKRWHTKMVSFLNPALIMIWHSTSSISPTSHSPI